MTNAPYLYISNAPGRLDAMIATAQQAERRGFPGIFTESPGDNIALSLAILERTERIIVGTGIAGIYLFMLGLGVSHVPFHEDMGVTYGKPLGDMRAYVSSIREVIGAEPCPPIIVAALRRKMSALAGEIGDGVMWANAALSHMPVSLEQLQTDRKDTLLLSSSAPACVSHDRGAALAAIRRYLLFYMKLPAYQNYFVEAGYRQDVETARQAGDDDEAIMAAISEELAADVGVFGTASEVRDRVDDWNRAGIEHLILDSVSATSSDRLQAAREVMDAFE